MVLTHSLSRVGLIPDQIRGKPTLSKIKTLAKKNNIVMVGFIPDQIRGKPTLNKTKTPSILFICLSKV